MVASASWDALGTWCEVLTVDDVDLSELATLARERLAAIEAACGPGDSELASLVPGRAQRVSPLLATALSAAQRESGFAGGLGCASGLRSDPAARTAVVPAGAATLLVPSVRAWAADSVADGCAAGLGVGCLLNLGGDIAVRGTAPDGGWQVEIDDGRAGPRGRPVIAMGWPGGLSTASTVGPAPPADAGGPPVPPGTWRTVTVAARSCARARAAATAALFLGDSAPRWLTQRELPARLVHAGGVVVHTNGWPRQRWLT